MSETQLPGSYPFAQPARENPALLNPALSGFAPAGNRTSPLTRDEMVAVIRRGESVLWNGFIISRETHLPSEAHLSVGDPDKERAAAVKLQAKIDDMQETLRQLKDGTLRAPAAAADVGPRQTAQAPPEPAQAPQRAAPAHGTPGAALTPEQIEDMRAAQRAALLRDSGVERHDDPRVTTSAPPGEQ